MSGRAEPSAATRRDAGSQSASVTLREAREAPAVVARQLVHNRPLLTDLARFLADRRPRLIATCARGSSHNAALYAKYLIETRLGLPVWSSEPSVGTLYRSTIPLRDALLLCISQSGASWDLVENARWATRQGAYVVSLLNTTDSPLGDASDLVVPLRAGHERGVAATKSHIASLSAILQLVGHLGQDTELLGLLDGLPDQLERAGNLDWSRAAPALGAGRDTYVVARGLSTGAAHEIALKFKEECGLHAEAFSAAEVMHGPLALIHSGFPVLLFAQSDETEATSRELRDRLWAAGARVFSAGLSTNAGDVDAGDHELPVLAGVHPAVAPLTLTQSCYGLVELVAREKGVDPDRPLHSSKVTRTR